jgi:galactonate dehydratase
MTFSRRNFLKSASLGALLPLSITTSSKAERKENSLLNSHKDSSLLITDISVHIVKVNQRGNWVFVELKTNKGITGLGEASHGVAGTTVDGKQSIQKEIADFFELVKGTSSFSIEQYRQRGWAKAQSGRVSRTAFSAIEQALWDINGKALGVPVYQLLGGKVRDKIQAYANINRATNEKDANGRRPASAFQKNAELSLKQGFKAIKMAPFDEMKALPSTPQQIQADVDHAIHCIEEVRKTIGTNIDLLVDVHSHLDQELGIQVARRVEPLNLFWFEEPVNPEKFGPETKAITDSTSKTTAGGESIFGREGFAPLIQLKALDILMPDVKHCGGIQELKYIAAMAETAGLKVAPHNPSGPIATAASVQAVATISNFTILEMAYGEVPWRSLLTTPEEQFVDGYITVSDQPGFGFQLNQMELAKHV